MNHNKIIFTIFSESDRERRRDKLSALIVSVRKGDYKISLEEAEALYKAQLEEAKRPEGFDGLMYRTIWSLIQYCPPYETLRKISGHQLANPRTICRGCAIHYLLNNYPDLQEELLKKHQDDPDPEVQDEIARFLLQKDKRQAIEHWEKALMSNNLSHELAETIPQCIAYFADMEDYKRYEELSQRFGGRTIWGIIAMLIKKKMERGWGA